MSRYIFSSESVGQGHPDKVCDQISDGILDYFISQDKESRVAVECFVKDNFLVIGGEITSKAKADNEDIEKIARNIIKEIGYDKDEYGFNGNNCEIRIELSQQSRDIARGVDSGKEKEQGAGDQGLMFGYACNETEELMPLAISLSHKLLIKLNELRINKELSYLRPDSKCQISVEYIDDKPKRITAVVLSTQHDPEVRYDILKKDIVEKVIKPVCGKWLYEGTKFYINPTGRFVIGGPAGDTGLTGRKIIVDTYGGFGRHGGGCFSGKDPSKVDRSAAYAARYIAKNIVASKIADKCEVQLAYAIGVAEPVSIYINCFNTNKISENEIHELIKKKFPLKPADIIKELDLKRAIYQKTACFGHFGRNEEDFTWEKVKIFTH